MSSVTVQSIAGTYNLVSLNGDTKAAKRRNLSLSIRGGVNPGEVRINARVANVMNGQGTLSSTGVLTAMLASTEMMGPRDLMEVEAALSKGFDAGFQVTVSPADGLLTLKSGSNTLIYKRH